ncbi:MAG: HPP family protein [Arcobacter sp.]|nr:MAG: HPP family protein [Arcobacter sp.]
MIKILKIYFSRMKASDSSPKRKPLTDIGWSALGAFISLYCISVFNEWLGTSSVDSFFLIGSFGASAILIYGAPHLDFSQPRNFVGGHLIATCIGVLVYQYLPFNLLLLSAIAVSLSLVGMHLTCTMHPPGGATALIAIIGSDKIHELGFYLILSPILSVSLVMLFIALVVNNLSSNPERHYPRYWI